MKEAIRKYLGIKEPRDYSKDINKLQAKTDETLTEFRKTMEKFCEITCTQCNKTIVTYPYGGGYYRASDGDVLCSTDCLDTKKGSHEE
jgi:phage FluMu protein Com